MWRSHILDLGIFLPFRQENQNQDTNEDKLHDDASSMGM
jgi:hypothetical protein